MKARAELRRRPPAGLQGPFNAENSYWSVSQVGAFDGVVQREGEESEQSRAIGIPFDLVSIVAAPATGTTTTLIGSATGVALGPVPVGFRAVVLAICPYLEGATGPITQPRIPTGGLATVIRWRLLLDGSPAPPYHSITTILAPWGSPGSHVPLLEVPTGRTLTCNVTNTDPGGLYTYLGIRLVGRWIPWSKEWR